MNRTKLVALQVGVGLGFLLLWHVLTAYAQEEGTQG